MFLQGLRKVTSGTPGDNQIALYCFHADAFVSADGALVDIINKARPEMPAVTRGQIAENGMRFPHGRLAIAVDTGRAHRHL